MKLKRGQKMQERSMIQPTARQAFRTAYGLIRACGCARAAWRNLAREGRLELLGMLFAAERCLNAPGQVQRLAGIYQARKSARGW